MNPIEMRSYYAIRMYGAPSNIGIVFLKTWLLFFQLQSPLKEQDI